MPQALIILGVFLALAGIGSIAAGAPSWVLGLGLGTALIQSGAVGLVGGFLLVGIGFVLRSLRDLSRRLDAMALSASAMQSGATPSTRSSQSAPISAPRPSAKREATPPLSPRREPPPFSGREDTREPAFSDRESNGSLREPEERPRNRPRGRAPEPDFSAPSRPSTLPERGRDRPRPTSERAPAFENYEADEPSPPPSRPAPGGMSTTIVRSGIIGGMAYTLYTDGSIEAELPIGTVRFASIEELQDHVSQTGEDADVDFGGPKN